MRSSRRLIGITPSAFGLALVCWCAIAFAQNPPENAKTTTAGSTFRIAGIVVSAASGTPLARTRVSIADTKNRRNAQWIITGDDGHFEFNHLSAGKYALQGARRGFVAAAYEQHGQFSTAIVTGPALDSENLILRLEPTATITGRILDERGEPVRKAQVRLFRENHSLGVSQITPSGGASTDDQGTYEFAPVVPGTYFVSATAHPWYALHPPSTHTEGGENSPVAVDASLDVAYPTTYYPGTTETEGALPIPVKGGDHAEIDLQLEPVPALHLVFHVQNEQNGFQTPTLQKRVFDSVENAEIDSRVTRNIRGVQGVSSDTFELVGVPAGRYMVRMHGSSPGEAEQAIEMNLTKNGEELETTSGEPLGRVKVSVKILGEEKLPQQLFVTLRDSKLRNVDFLTVDQNGEVNFEGLAPGKYAIVAIAQGKPYSAIRTSSAGTERSGNSFEMTPGSSLSISALLVGGTVKVEGFVKRAGKAAAGVMVVLVPTDPESNVELFRRDQSDSDGSFALPDVVPGSYTVIAIEDGWSLDWSRPTVLARYTPRGQKLTTGPQAQGMVGLPEPVEVQPR